MSLPVRHLRVLLLALLLPFAALGGAVAAGRIQVSRNAGSACVDGLGNDVADCLAAGASVATLLAGALLAALVVAYATVHVTRLRLVA